MYDLSPSFLLFNEISFQVKQKNQSIRMFFHKRKQNSRAWIYIPLSRFRLKITPTQQNNEKPGGGAHMEY